MLDRIVYFFQSRATHTFKAAFSVLLGLMVLRVAGSSAITITGTTRPGRLNVSDITAPPINGDNFDDRSLFSVKLNEAVLITRLEQVHGIFSGWQPEPNWFIPLPYTLEPNIETTATSYETDVVSFNYSCHWEAPSDISDDGMIIGNETWLDFFVQNSLWSGVVNTSTVVQLVPAQNATGSSTFLFLGDNYKRANGTVGDIVTMSNNTDYKVNLTGLPTADLKSLTGLDENPPLATLLICDPRLDFGSGVALLRPSPDYSTPDLKVISKYPANSPAVGNLDQLTVRTIFSWGLAKSGGPVSDNLDNSTDSLGLGLFFDSGTRVQDDGALHTMSPLDLPLIEEHMGSYVLSALKAFTGGFMGNSSLADESAAQGVTTVLANYENARLALWASVIFTIAHSGLFVILAFGLIGLQYLNYKQDRALFDLASVERELSADKGGGSYTD
ncbi:hypothetical protein AN958_10110 [Leucoagaricus sp. SymC.cos]|nr:hypothetical protein AN958_10110 [Leucoagaricus sp. SymC.cos]